MSSASSTKPEVSIGEAGTHDGMLTNTRSGRPRVAAMQHAHAVGAEHVADLVRVDDDAGHAARHDGARELARREHGALDVQVAVDQARAARRRRRGRSRSRRE